MPPKTLSQAGAFMKRVKLASVIIRQLDIFGPELVRFLRRRSSIAFRILPDAIETVSVRNLL
jgi:hypothetical protein